MLALSHKQTIKSDQLTNVKTVQQTNNKHQFRLLAKQTSVGSKKILFPVSQLLVPFLLHIYTNSSTHHTTVATWARYAMWLTPFEENNNCNNNNNNCRQVINRTLPRASDSF